MRVGASRPHFDGNPDVLHQFLARGAVAERRFRLPFDVIGALRDVRHRNGDQLLGLLRQSDFDTRLRATMAAADSLGATTKTTPHEKGVMVRNYSCPVAIALRGESFVCRAIAAFFSEAKGRAATEMCLRIPIY